MERSARSAPCALAHSTNDTFSQLLASCKNGPGRTCHLRDSRHIPQPPVQKCLGRRHITAGIRHPGQQSGALDCCKGCPLGVEGEIRVLLPGGAPHRVNSPVKCPRRLAGIGRQGQQGQGATNGFLVR